MKKKAALINCKKREQQEFLSKSKYHGFQTTRSQRSIAVLVAKYGRFVEPGAREIRARSARERLARKIKTSFSVAPAPTSSRFFCPRPPLLLSNQNRHATQAKLQEKKKQQLAETKRVTSQKMVSIF